ncbi:hypothetical protein, partial [Aeromonas lacus]|uniref:hypothetical protein n=1 Tax=Aeromonas lacus TaxID=558884 RepID=UPI00126A6849
MAKDQVPLPKGVTGVKFIWGAQTGKSDINFDLKGAQATLMNADIAESSTNFHMVFLKSAVQVKNVSSDRQYEGHSLNSIIELTNAQDKVPVRMALDLGPIMIPGGISSNVDYAHSKVVFKDTSSQVLGSQTVIDLSKGTAIVSLPLSTKFIELEVPTIADQINQPEQKLTLTAKTMGMDEDLPVSGSLTVLSKRVNITESAYTNGIYSPVRIYPTTTITFDSPVSDEVHKLNISGIGPAPVLWLTPVEYLPKSTAPSVEVDLAKDQVPKGVTGVKFIWGAQTGKSDINFDLKGAQATLMNADIAESSTNFHMVFLKSAVQVKNVSSDRQYEGHSLNSIIELTNAQDKVPVRMALDLGPIMIPGGISSNVDYAHSKVVFKDTSSQVLGSQTVIDLSKGTAIVSLPLSTKFIELEVPTIADQINQPEQKLTLTAKTMGMDEDLPVSGSLTVLSKRVNSTESAYTNGIYSPVRIYPTTTITFDSPVSDEVHKLNISGIGPAPVLW